MIENKSAASPNISVNPPAKGVRLDRRALLRAGAGATPVLLTLASNPVSASSSCVVASSFVSVATFKSRNPTTTVVNCSSKTAEDWRNACMANPSMDCVKPLVSTTFGSTTSAYNGKTLRQVLCDPAGIVTTGDLGVLQHLTALCLSISQGTMRLPAGNVSQGYLAAVWSNYKANGGRYVLRASGIDWDTPKLINWLRIQLNYSVRI